MWALFFAQTLIMFFIRIMKPALPCVARRLLKRSAAVTDFYTTIVLEVILVVCFQSMATLG